MAIGTRGGIQRTLQDTQANYFDDLCDYFRSPNIWKKDNTGWKVRKSLEKI